MIRFIVRNLRLPRERSFPCPGFWEVTSKPLKMSHLVGRSLLAWVSWPSQIVTMWYRSFEPQQQCDLGWGLWVTWYQLCLLKAWQQIHYVGSQLCTRDRAPIKALHTEFRVSFPGWHYFVHVTYQYQENNLVLTPWGEDSGSSMFGLFPGLGSVFLSWLILTGIL